MGISTSKLQISLMGHRDRVVVTTRTTRYGIGRRVGDSFLLMTNNPSKKSGMVTVIGSMSTGTGAIEGGVLEVGKYMVFQHDGDGDLATKTSLVTRIEVEAGT